MRGLATKASAVLLAFTVPATAQTREGSAQPDVITNVVACRAVAEQSQRLACFDNAATALASAQESKQVAIIDQEEVRKARRGLFGFTLPKMRLFGTGDGNDANERIDSIDAKVASLSGDSGGWVIMLDTGARWQQIDGEYINRPKIDQAISIKRGSVGGYTAKVGSGRAFRVRRLAE